MKRLVEGPWQAPEFRKNKRFLTPAFAGVTAFMTFYKAVTIALSLIAFILSFKTYLRSSSVRTKEEVSDDEDLLGISSKDQL